MADITWLGGGGTTNVSDSSNYGGASLVVQLAVASSGASLTQGGARSGVVESSGGRIFKPNINTSGDIVLMYSDDGFVADENTLSLNSAANWTSPQCVITSTNQIFVMGTNTTSAEVRVWHIQTVDTTPAIESNGQIDDTTSSTSSSTNALTLDSADFIHLVWKDNVSDWHYQVSQSANPTSLTDTVSSHWEQHKGASPTAGSETIGAFNNGRSPTIFINDANTGDEVNIGIIESAGNARVRQKDTANTWVSSGAQTFTEGSATASSHFTIVGDLTSRANMALFFRAGSAVLVRLSTNSGLTYPTSETIATATGNARCTGAGWNGTNFLFTWNDDNDWDVRLSERTGAATYDTNIVLATSTSDIMGLPDIRYQEYNHVSPTQVDLTWNNQTDGRLEYIQAAAAGGDPPTTGDKLIFPTGTGNATYDSSAPASLVGIDVQTGYVNTLTFAITTFALTGDFDSASGSTLDLGSTTFNCSTDVELIGTITGGTSIVNLNGATGNIRGEGYNDVNVNGDYTTTGNFDAEDVVVT